MPYFTYLCAIMWLKIDFQDTTNGIGKLFLLSGTVTLFFFALLLGRYTIHNLSHQTKNSVDIVLKTIAFISEQVVFAYLGIVASTSLVNHLWSPLLFSIVFPLSFIGRSLSVFPIFFILNRLQPQQPVTIKQQIVMILSGLKGAVAFILALSIPCVVTKHGSACENDRDLIITTTLSIVITTTVLIGCSIEWIATEWKIIVPVTLGTFYTEMDTMHSVSRPSNFPDTPGYTSPSRVQFPFEKEKEIKKTAFLTEEEMSRFRGAHLSLHAYTRISVRYTVKVGKKSEKIQAGKEFQIGFANGFLR
ncbi:sodium/hydrogen exchanger 3 protein [Cardiosporidium cionae]|uniref:Sodium/hydrogen exchanger 3 protein n=1 Tax=Cardiosporidium cionae TaxID=476202 RepID=A0ABQ7J895_9APIC|nr:sodium/hydrogen exchanger 3 protein [Cardiosporidium cionae]|eukprot:KAF8820221.1 sodium/hydrogen exchanger 3 protein [Cardiosporidium cionae]